MAAFYIDSSSLVKRYVAETSSTWLNRLVDPSAKHRIYLARITGVEIYSAVIRRQRFGSLSLDDAIRLLMQFHDEFETQFRIVEMTRSVLNQAMDVAGTHALRAYDAVQLATAIDVNRQRVLRGLSELTLISSDAELNAVAATTGLSIEDPNSHP